MKRPIRLAVVGLGRIAQAHLHSIKASPEETELVAVVSRRESVAQEIAQQFGAQRYYLDYAQALADPEIDGVVLCTPNRNHAEETIQAARAGKHVLVEKIMANSLAECDAMIEACQRAGVVLSVAQCRRYFKATLEARASLDEIGGRVIHVVHHLGVLFPQAPTAWWRDDDMQHVALDQNGPHVIDSILYLVGERPVRVYCQEYRNNPDWQGTDEMSLVITFESGAIGSGHISLNSKPEVNERFVVGPSGTMRMSGDRNLWVNGEQRVAEEFQNYLQGGSNFNAQVREFARAIDEGREPLTSGRDVRKVVEVIVAARASARSGQAVAL